MNEPKRMAETIAFVLMTPHLAAQLLERNRRNRTINNPRVESYRALMRAGLWYAMDPIMVDWNGDLINGQHRLWAVILENVSVRMILQEGVDPIVYRYIDSGRARSVSDAVEHETGIEKKSSPISAAARIVLTYETRNITSRFLGSYLPSDRGPLFDEINAHKEQYERLASRASASDLRQAKMPASAWIAFLVLVERAGWDQPTITAFSDGLFIGDELRRNDARLALRRWTHGRGAGRNGPDCCSAAIRAFTHWQEGYEPEQIRVTKKFPRVPTPEQVALRRKMPASMRQHEDDDDE